MAENYFPQGVLDDNYASRRKTKTELIYRYKTRAQFIVNAIKRFLPNHTGLNILDFGSAEGLVLLELDRLLPNNNIVGVEFSRALIEASPPLPNNIHLVNGDITDLSSVFKKEEQKKYDVVCALAVLEHLEDPLLAVKEAFVYLKKGGIFIATSPASFWDKASAKFHLLKDDHHLVEMTKKKMIELCQQAGFEIVGFQRFMWAPIAFLPYLKIPISPSASLKIDSVINKILIFNWLFVNQMVIARKR